MFIARILGNVVTTQKVETMVGRKLLIVDPLLVDAQGGKLDATGKTYVAVDSLGAGEGDLVLVAQGSSARMTPQTGQAPVDCVVIGIIDSVFAGEREIFRKGGESEGGRARRR
ncbi:MAG TPA: EutN/CcmL family microcompartment protein [Phycisphaerae bacterium]|nr:EutN/CcmL family microcompartment protein [Phycisphaerae bacterium]